MSSRDNFKQAAKELFGLDSTRRERTPLSGFVAEMDEEMADTATGYDALVAGQEAPEVELVEPVPLARPAPQAVAEPAPYTPQQVSYAPQPTYTPQVPVSQEPVGQQEPADGYALVDSRRETSVIAKGTTIVGRVRTDGHIEVMGKIEGNVDAEGNVAVSGRISGNVRGHHVELLSAQIKGNLNVAAGVFVSSDSVVIGDITAEKVVFDGRIKGNVVTTQSAEFNRNSYLLGDITTRSIAIAPGAVINGMIRTEGTPVEDEIFDEFGML